MKTENIELAIRTMHESMPKGAMDAFSELAELKRLAEIGENVGRTYDQGFDNGQQAKGWELNERQTIALERIAEFMRVEKTK